MRPCLERLEDRSCPATIPVVALSVQPGALTPPEVDRVGDMLSVWLAPLAPRGWRGVEVADGIRAGRLLRPRGPKAFVVQLVEGIGPFNFWGQSDGDRLATVYVGAHGGNVEQVAVTAAHELGHLMGLDHPAGDDPNNLMNIGPSLVDAAHAGWGEPWLVRRALRRMA